MSSMLLPLRSYMVHSSSDSTKPGVRLTTRSFGDTRESNINVIVEFPKLIYGSGFFVIEVQWGAIYKAGAYDEIQNCAQLWQNLEMNIFWLGISGGGLLITHFLTLVLLRGTSGTAVHRTLSVPRFDYFLLVLMLPCISRSSPFVMIGNIDDFSICNFFVIIYTTKRRAILCVSITIRCACSG
ncbi:hypothetical protein GIB67_012005 [Kingdonia uniflora]|uniref:Uncharacterized protein n=1 Tax=Kingdonia uniflora TaxID=39325 RepID=A0A7J7M098_9MAGN|nr:hypothetical protein GIB67_012005 [Kingdonia uniflora]